MSKGTKFDILILDILYHALQAWEDLNLVVDFNFKKTNTIIRLTEDYTAKIGSELDQFGNLARGINNFKNFRNTLDSGKTININDYLPRVPKDLRETYCTDVWMHYTNQVKPVNLIPYYINKWLTLKKVYKIENSDSIPLIDYNKEYYFHLLPKEPFLIKLSEPIQIGNSERLQVDGSSKITDIPTTTTHIIINHFDETGLAKHLAETGNNKDIWQDIANEDHKDVQIFAIPDNIEDYILDDKIRSTLNELLHVKNVAVNKHVNRLFKLVQGEGLKELTNVISANYLSFFRVTILDDHLPKEMKAEAAEHTVGSRIISTFSNSKDSNSEIKINFIKFINGFAKLFHETGSATSTNSTPVNIVTQSVGKKTDWFEVPITGTKYCTVKNSKQTGAKMIIRGEKTGKHIASAPKDPHPRESHNRNYKDDNGNITKTIQVSGSIIHEERYTGSTTIIKVTKE